MTRGVAHLTLTVFVLAGAGPAWSQQLPERAAVSKRLERELPYPLRRIEARRPSISASAVVVNETEPNDDPSTADGVNIGDQGTGVISPARDIDHWAFSAVQASILSIDVDAAQFGSSLDPVIGLFAPDGETLLAVSDDADGLDSEIKFTVPNGGTHYIAIVSFDLSAGGSDYTYAINFNTAAPGVGDPVTLLAQGVGAPIGIAAGPMGDTYITDVDGGRVLRMTQQGAVSTFRSVDQPAGVAVDVFGNVLVASTAGTVQRFTPGGASQTFIDDVQTPFWVAVGPDGRIWVSDLGDLSIRRYDLHGNFEQSFDISALDGAGPIAFSPTGELHFSNGPAIYRLAGGTPELVLSSSGFIWGFTFDADGNIYVPDSVNRRIALYNSSGSPLEDPLVNGLQVCLAVGFERFSDGTPGNRLFATDVENGLIAVVNGDGVPAGGADIVPFLAFIPFDAALDELLLGDGGVTQQDLELLDAAGNANGRFDTGDFLAYFGAAGVVPPGAASVTLSDAKGGVR